jgi:hypothetical protein
MNEDRHERQNDARLQAHYAAQWLGRVGAAFVPPQPDYSHTSMGWDDALGGFVTNALRDGARLGLRLGDLAFVFLDKDGKQTGVFSLDGHTDADVQQWLRAALAKRALDAGLLDKTSAYEIPAHAVAAGGAYGISEIAGELRELATWFAAADAALDNVRVQMAARDLSASPVRCWPHHFDLATLIAIDAGGGEHGRSVNAGFSPGDAHYDEAYFYVSPYPYPDPAKLPALRSKLGHWHTQDFTAAIAPAHRIVLSGDRKADTEAFLDEAVAAAIQALG